MLRMMSISAA